MYLFKQVEEHIIGKWGIAYNCRYIFYQIFEKADGNIVEKSEKKPIAITNVSIQRKKKY